MLVIFASIRLLMGWTGCSPRGDSLQRLHRSTRRTSHGANQTGRIHISDFRNPRTIYQIITLFPNDTIIHNVSLALLGLSAARWNPLIDIKHQGHLIDHARAALEQVGLAHIAERPLTQTSYGERRRVEIAMALAQKPKVLLLDEPFAGLSIDERRDVQQLLLAIPRDVTIVMIEHNMDVALEFAERITLLHFGEVIVEGNRAEVVDNPRTREVYLGH
jgi:branched-chain amino acid transport system ATP-binding protein